MKKTIVTLALMYALNVNAQDPNSWLDFWVGEWQVTWDEKDGKTGSGINSVTRVLDDKVIQENFSTLVGAAKGYKGTSLSTYNPIDKQWHQGYVDNQGVYLNFIGERSGDRFIFKTEPVEQEGSEIIQRMVFYNITEKSFMWDWEVTRDGGKTWSLSWRIAYERMMDKGKVGSN